MHQGYLKAVLLLELFTSIPHPVYWLNDNQHQMPLATAFNNGKNQVISNACIQNAAGDIINIQVGVPQSDVPQTTLYYFTHKFLTAWMPFHTQSLSEVSGGKLLPIESVPDTSIDDDDNDDSQSARSHDSDVTHVVMIPDHKKAFIPSNAFHRGPSSYKIYTEHMLKLGLGYPIWLPQPNRNLPVKYRREGTSIGDVGIITPDGRFDVLFNVWLTAKDQIRPDLSNDFYSMQRPTKSVSSTSLYPPGSKASSLDIDSTIDMDTNDIRYTCKDGNIGAILSLPHGASIETLDNEEDLQKFIARNALIWYKYAFQNSGRKLDRHSLYFVTGSIKSKTWGIATFDTAVQKREASLTLSESRNVNFPSYMWKDSGGATTFRTGPSPDPDLTPENADIENQNLFLRGFKISLPEKVWNDIREPVDIAVDDKSGGKPFGPDKSYEPNNRKESRNDESGSGTHFSSPTSFCHNMSISSFPANDTPPHPLNAINDMLLSKFPEARIAVTHDNLWCEIANQGGYDAVELQETVQNRYVIGYCEETGACTLKPRLNPLIASECVDLVHEWVNRAVIPEPILALTQVTAQLGCVKSPNLEFVVDSQPDATLYSRGHNDTPIADIHQGETEFGRIERVACLGTNHQSADRPKRHPGEACISDIASWNTLKSPEIDDKLYDDILTDTCLGSIPDKLEFSLQIAQCLHDLHSSGQVHGNISPGNIHLMRQGGTSSIVTLKNAGLYAARSSNGRFMPVSEAARYMAPEYVETDCFIPTKEGDLYGWASTSYAIIQGGPLMPSWNDSQCIVTICNGAWESFFIQPEGVPNDAWLILKRCLSRVPGDRPLITEVTSVFRRYCRQSPRRKISLNRKFSSLAPHT